MNYFTVINLNASRIANVVKLGEINDFISDYKPDVVGIQEVNISAALKVFSGEYQVYCNIESNAKDGEGNFFQGRVQWVIHTMVRSK